MTQFTQRSFTVPQTGKVDPRRDCKVSNHWPRVQRDGTYRCWFCGKACQVDGTDREPTP